MKAKVLRAAMSLLTICVAICMQCGCTKVSHNGALDGMWQVMEVMDGDKVVESPAKYRYYYNFYLHTCQLSTSDGRPPLLVGNMTYDGKKLNLEFPFVENEEASTSYIKHMMYWGLPESGTATFNVLLLDRNNLVMSRGDLTVTCRKF